MSTHRSAPNHAVWVAAGVLTGAIAIYGDFWARESQRSIAQFFLWTFFVVAVFSIALRRTLQVRFQQFVTFVLAIGHLGFLWLIRQQFPLGKALFVLPYAFVEVVVLIVLYALAGQILDPSGPYGPTAEDRKRWAMRRSKRSF